MLDTLAEGRLIVFLPSKQLYEQIAAIKKSPKFKLPQIGVQFISSGSSNGLKPAISDSVFMEFLTDLLLSQDQYQKSTHVIFIFYLLNKNNVLCCAPLYELDMEKLPDEFR